MVVYWSRLLLLSDKCTHIFTIYDLMLQNQLHVILKEYVSQEIKKSKYNHNS